MNVIKIICCRIRYSIPNIEFNTADYRVDTVVAISYNTLREVSDYMITVGKRLKDLRHSVRLSQKAFAPKVGLTQSAINRYENNQAEASYKTLIAYADYFDVSLDYIYGRTNKPQGKLYEFRPRIEDNDEMRLFIEMCFDPESPMSGKLKDTLLQMMKGGEENGDKNNG